MKILKKILNVLIDVLVVMILLISAVILTFALTSQDTGSPNIFGYTFNTIQSESMEPVFYKGDLLIGKVASSDEVYQKGDIVMFQSTIVDDDGNENVAIKCHRIIEVQNQNGFISYITKGDNNPTDDSETDGHITNSEIVGVYETEDYQGEKVSSIGSIIDYLQSFWGFFFVIVLPMIIFFIYELIRVILNLFAYSKEKALVAAQEAAQSAELSEQQKQKAIEEYLAQQAEKEKLEASSPEPSNDAD
jgi:signal peptidase